MDNLSTVQTPAKIKSSAVTATPVKSTAKRGRPKKVQQDEEDDYQEEDDFDGDLEEEQQNRSLKRSSTKPKGRPKKAKPNTKDQQPVDDQEEIELNIYQKYKHALSTTIKSELVFREQETKEIKNFLTDHLKKGKSTSIYISGKWNEFCSFSILLLT